MMSVAVSDFMWQLIITFIQKNKNKETCHNDGWLSKQGADPQLERLLARSQISICCVHCRDDWDCTSGRKNLIWTVSYACAMLHLLYNHNFPLISTFFSRMLFFRDLVVWLYARGQWQCYFLVSKVLKGTESSKRDVVQVTKPGGH